MPSALREIALQAPDAVRETLDSLGRTEDVRLSPSRGRIAIACYATETIAVGDIELAASPSGPAAALTRLEVVSSASLREPHGLDWRDDDTLVVASRAGGLAVLRLAGGELIELSSTSIDAPGSVAVRPVGDERHEALVCGNWQNVVTAFELDENGVLAAGRPTLRRWLDLPDGVAVAASGRWLAVSNHNTHSVLVFDREAANELSDPVAVLRGVAYPHGLRFVTDDRLLVVADAGAPHLHVFVGDGADWAVGAAYPVATVQVLDGPTFARGRTNPMEGGPKGIDVDTRSGALLVTCEELPLGVFDATALLQHPEGFGTDGAALLRHELDALTTARADRDAAAALRAHIAAITSTKAWRLTAPARRLQASLRAMRRQSRAAEAAPEAPSALTD